MNNNMNYTINNNFCDRETAKDIIDFCLKFGESFSYNPTERWDCRRIYDDNFKTKIIDLLTKNQEKINWYWLSINTGAKDLILQNLDNISNKNLKIIIWGRKD